jgi:hypothetical protein
MAEVATKLALVRCMGIPAVEAGRAMGLLRVGESTEEFKGRLDRTIKVLSVALKPVAK